MREQNMGRLDRTLRFIVGVALIPIGLFALRGWQGNLVGILAAAFALLPLMTSLTGFCPGYVPFGISTKDREGPPEVPRAPEKGDSVAAMIEAMTDQCQCVSMMTGCGAEQDEEGTATGTRANA